MKVLVIGCTGVLGRAAIRDLRDAGHSIAGSASSFESARKMASAGVTPVGIDVFDPESVASAIAATEARAVINAATRIPSDAAAALPGAWSANSRLRREGSAAIAEACVSADIDLLVQHSVSLGYADGGDRVLSEDAPTDFRGPVDTVPHAIAAAEWVAGSGRRGVCLLFGRFYGDDANTRGVLHNVRTGHPVLMGDPEGWCAMAHVDSAASAIVAALDAPSGTYNVNDPALRKSTLAGAYRAAAGREPVFLPHEVTLLAPGAEVLSRSQRTSAAAFEAATGWSSVHPDFEESYAALTRDW